MRAPVWLRLLVVLAAGAGIVVCAQGVAAAYRETQVYRNAPDCAAGYDTGPGDRCVGWEGADVVDKDSTENCTTDSNGVRSCTTDYELSIRRPDRTQWLGVSYDIYDAARRGDHAALRTWQGSVARMTVRDRTETYPLPSAQAGWWRVGAVWLLLGLTLWAGLSGYLRHLFAFGNFGWLWLTIPVSWLVDSALGLFDGGVGDWVISTVAVIFGIGWMIGARRVSLRRFRPGHNR